MEISDQRANGYIVVWLTNEEQQTVDRPALTKELLADAGNPRKCKVVYFLSGSAPLYDRIEGLLLRNAKG